VTAQLVGPIDFPDIANNGFADSVGDPAYYSLGQGINDNVEGRWYGDIMIPGTGTTPVPINFATTSDDGSMLYIDGNAVVYNNNFQGASQATGLAYLTPGPHTIDVEYYQGYGAATLDVQWGPTGGGNFVDIPNSAFIVSVNGLIKSGTGTLTLATTNTYSGSTIVNAGTLVVTANSAMGPATASGIFVNPGGALAFSSGIRYTVAEPITISGSGPAGRGAIENISGKTTLAGPITLLGTATIGTDAGALTLTGEITAGPNTLTVVGAGTTTIDGNIIIQGGGLTLAGSGTINVAGNVDLGASGNLTDLSSGQDSITGVISDAGTSGFVTKSGSGTLTLSNINTYSGPTTVDAGELVVNGQLPGSAITVSSGGALGGDGSVSAIAVQGGGFLAPGDSPGTLTAGTLSLATGSTFVEQLGGTSAGKEYDQTVILPGGTVSLGGATLKLSFLGAFRPKVGQQFTIIANRSGQSVVGTFSQGGTYAFGGYIFGINYAGGAGHDVVLTVLSRSNIRTAGASTGGDRPSAVRSGQSATFVAAVAAGTPALGNPMGIVTFEDVSTDKSQFAWRQTANRGFYRMPARSPIA
jgi:autotransporter-associated beta strand protein